MRCVPLSYPAYMNQNGVIQIHLNEQIQIRIHITDTDTCICTNTDTAIDSNAHTDTDTDTDTDTARHKCIVIDTETNKKTNIDKYRNIF